MLDVPITPHFDRLRPTTLREASGLIPHPYGVPAGFYQQLWDWDGYFIAVHLAGRKQPEYLRYWVLNFVSATKELGYPAGCITPQRRESGHRSFTLKPFMAQAAEAAGRLESDDAWVKPHYDEICQIVRRREKTHRDTATGLYFWDNAMQSGADNNPADSSRPETNRLFLSCDLNAFQHAEYSALATLALRLGHTADATTFQAEADHIRTALQAHLWCHTTGTFLNRRRDTGARVHAISYSNFVPLWAGLATPEQAATMFEKHLLSEKHLLTQWGARSLSRQDRTYSNAPIIDPYSNWRGPIWPIANYFYTLALHRYGFTTQAADLATRVAKLCLTDLDACGSMHENYCAETGTPLAPTPEQSPDGKGGGFIGWNLLIQDMLEITTASAPDHFAPLRLAGI